MTQRPPSGRGLDEIDEEEEVEEEEPRSFTTSVISAEGAFRVVLVLLTAWTLFEGFALATGAISAVDAGTDRTAERMLGGLMIVLGGVYAMIAWQRQRYRLLLWVPFAAQIAIVVPLLFSFDADRILLLVISSIFLVLMVYVWYRSRDLEEPYNEAEEYEDEEEDGEDEEDEASAADQRQLAVGRPVRRSAPPPAAPSTRSPSPREPARRPNKFRRRDG
jgi:hypothetical protein